jgi:hypothetical protein
MAETLVAVRQLPISDAAYGAGWDGDLNAPTKNAVFDKIETIGGASLASTTDVLIGTNTSKTVTPDALAALWEQGSDIASAEAISLGEGGYFNVTGTTTITDIDFATDKAGRVAWLKFAGALTLTHSATLILPNAQNVKTSAGDVMGIVSEGSDVIRCVSYCRAANYGSSTGANPTGTTSTTGVHAGLAVAFTPKTSGVALIIISGQGTNGNGDNGYKGAIRYGTGAAPANGAALTGTQVGGTIGGSCVVSSSATGTVVNPFSRQAIVTGLTIGTAYWIDLEQAAVTGGTATFTNVNVSVIEL